MFFSVSSVRRSNVCVLILMWAGALVDVNFISAQDAGTRHLVWSEEFNGKAIDRDTWTYDVGGHGFGNGQLEFNTDRAANSYIRDGKLVIEARRENYRGKAFTSARMTTQGRFAFQYGELEARIKVPDTADGIWPAFWMLGNNFPAVSWPQCGEVDILEIGGKEGIAKGLQHRRINCALHFADANDRKKSLVEWFNASTDLNDDYHRYRVVWTPQAMKFFLDEQPIGRWDIESAEFREFHQPFFLLVNVAVGSWTSSYTGLDQPGKITADFPAQLSVDWIRLYANEHTKVVLGGEKKIRGDFGVFTEREQVAGSLPLVSTETAASQAEFEYGENATLYLWNNLKAAANPVSASEGDTCWSFDVGAGNWFGMGVFSPESRNMNDFSDGTLHFDVQTTSNVPMRVGIKSSRTGDAWVALGDEKAKNGFARDGKWQRVSIPMSRFEGCDFSAIHQWLMLAGEAPSESFTLSVDNIWWETP